MDDRFIALFRRRAEQAQAPGQGTPRRDSDPRPNGSAAQIEAFAGCLEAYDLVQDRSTAVTVMVLMSSISIFLSLEETIGISAGHAETVALHAAARAAKGIDLEDTLEELGPGNSPRHGSLRCRTPVRGQGATVGAWHEPLV